MLLVFLRVFQFSSLVCSAIGPSSQVSPIDNVDLVHSFLEPDVRIETPCLLDLRKKNRASKLSQVRVCLALVLRVADSF
ncbi:hypothetical protein PR048_007472 [Dryococelus australis]|uniref:Secreted protein n=1 Tax=Dryococelus australis TaxID=614101 RepID=A0ABQ9HUB8_9NEOP|nr:hypothetical protein PR048_007472 [Dryococelus australis]